MKNKIIYAMVFFLQLSFFVDANAQTKSQTKIDTVNRAIQASTTHVNQQLNSTVSSTDAIQKVIPQHYNGIWVSTPAKIDQTGGIQKSAVALSSTVETSTEKITVANNKVAVNKIPTPVSDGSSSVTELPNNKPKN